LTSVVEIDVKITTLIVPKPQLFHENVILTNINVQRKLVALNSHTVENLFRIGSDGKN